MGWPTAAPGRRRELALAWLQQVEGDQVLESLDAGEAKPFRRAGT